MCFFAILVFTQHLIGLQLDLSARGIAPALLGKLLALNGALVIVVQPFASAWYERFAKHTVMAAGVFLIALGFGATGLAHTPLHYAGTIILWSLGEIAFIPLASATVAELAPPALRGSYQGVYQLAWGAAFTLGPMLSGAVLGHLGSRILWTGCFVLGTASALGQLLLGRARLTPRAASRTNHPRA